MFVLFPWAAEKNQACMYPDQHVRWLSKNHKFGPSSGGAQLTNVRCCGGARRKNPTPLHVYPVFTHIHITQIDTKDSSDARHGLKKKSNRRSSRLLSSPLLSPAEKLRDVSRQLELRELQVGARGGGADVKLQQGSMRAAAGSLCTYQHNLWVRTDALYMLQEGFSGSPKSRPDNLADDAASCYRSSLTGRPRIFTHSSGARKHVL